MARDVEDPHGRVFLASVRRRPTLMTNCTNILTLIPVQWSDGRDSRFHFALFCAGILRMVLGMAPATKSQMTSVMVIRAIISHGQT
jgi:hypothetical protein